MIQEYPKLQDTKSGVTQIFLEDWTWMGVTIPKGFPTDGTSSPWWSWSFVPRRGKYIYASYLHDYLLSVTTRKEAASKFREALCELESNILLRNFMYYGVRLYDKTKYRNFP